MSKDRPFEAIIFDLGGVIVPHDNAVLAERLASRCRSGVTTAELVATMRRQSWETGARIEELHALLSDELGYSAAWPQFVEDWSCHLGVDASMLAFVEQLAGAERVALFSNTNQLHWEHLIGVTDGRLGRFEAYLSHELGLAKPSLASFQEVARRTGVEPARAIFFDDVAANVEGARAAGFQAEVFESEAQLKRLLEHRGVRLAT